MRDLELYMPAQLSDARQVLSHVACLLVPSPGDASVFSEDKFQAVQVLCEALDLCQVLQQHCAVQP